MKIYRFEQGEGCPLVFFHGWGFDHSVWLPLVESLPSSYRLILVDLPGFGQTESQSWAEFSQNLIAELPKPFQLVGWSLGGLYAQRLALEYPDFVERLIVIASSPRFIKESIWPGIEATVFRNFHQRLLQNPPKVLDEFLRLHVGKNIRFSGQLPSESGLIMGLENLLDWDLRPHLDQLVMPTDYLFGRLDAIIPYQLMTEMQNRYPQFNYYAFRKSAHIPFLTEREAFVNLLNSYTH